MTEDPSTTIQYLSGSLDDFVVEAIGQTYTFDFTGKQGGVQVFPPETITYEVGPESVTDFTVINNEELSVLDGGNASNTTVLIGGGEIVEGAEYKVLSYNGPSGPFDNGQFDDNWLVVTPTDVSGGTASDTHATVYGGQYIGQGGTAYSATISGTGAGQGVESGGVAINTTLTNGGAQTVEAGGTAEDTMVGVGCTLILQGNSVLAGANTDNGGQINGFGGFGAVPAAMLTGTLVGSGPITGGFIVANGAEVSASDDSGFTLSNGTITVSSGGSESGVTLGDLATVELKVGAVNQGGFTFKTTATNALNAAATLILDAPSGEPTGNYNFVANTGPSHEVTNFGMGDYIEIANLAASSILFPAASNASASNNSGRISVIKNGVIATIVDVQGNFSGLDFNWQDSDDNTYIWLAPSLFTNGPDNVNFNQLTAAQVAEIDGGAGLYDSLNGTDTVTLPNTADYKLTPLISWDQHQPFITGDGSDTIQGGNGDDIIQLGTGAGTTIYGSPGDDTITGSDLGYFTVDYTKGEFPNFASFGSAGTTQRITGGHKKFVTQPLEQNTIILPDNAEYYQFNVNLTKLADDTLGSALTTISQVLGDADYDNISIDTIDVERVEFAAPITTKVTLTTSQYSTSASTSATNPEALPFEMLQLETESYDNFVTFGASRPDGLATQSNDPDIDINEYINIGPAARGWSPVSAMQLGMAPADFNAPGATAVTPQNFTFVNGVYQATDPNVGASIAYALPSVPNLALPEKLLDALKGGSFPSWAYGSLSQNGSVTPAEGLAMVLQGVVNGKVTLAVVFRGWSEQADTSQFGDTEGYYALYAPLILALQNYLAQSGTGVTQVLLAGQDIGGSMVQWAMQDLAASVPGINVQGYTFGSLGAENAGQVIGGSGNVENFEEDTDPYYILSQRAQTSLAAFVAANTLETVAGIKVPSTVAGVAAGWIAGSFLSNYLNNNYYASLYKQKYLDPAQVIIDGDTGNNGSGFGNTPLSSSHDLATYQQDVGKITAFAFDAASPFYSTDLANALRSGSVDPEIVKIAVGSSGSQFVNIYDDNYALGYLPNYTANTNNSNIGVIFRWNNLTALPTDAQHLDPVTVDGGNDPGLINILQLPGFHTSYQWYQTGTSWTLKYQGTDIADLYRIQRLVFGDGAIYNLNGSNATVQTPTAGQQTLTVDPSYASVNTGNGNLAIYGSPDGNDFIAVGDGNDSITEGRGDDTIVDSDPANAGDLTIIGGPGDSYISTGAGNTTFLVQGGNNTIDFGVGSVNTLDFSAARGAVTVDLASGTAEVASGGDDTLENVQVVKGSAFDDTFTVGTGKETFIGGGGKETVVFSQDYAAYTVTYSGADDGLVTDAAGDVYTLTDIQTLQFADQTVAFDALPGETNWAKPVSGNFGAAADWSADQQPGPSDDAFIDVAGVYTVSVSSATVAALTIDDTGAVLDVVGGTFAPRALTNAGTIAVLDGATLQLAGTVSNSGGIDLNSTGDPTKLALNGEVTIAGGGTVSLSNNANNAIVGMGSATGLFNEDDKISGAGAIGGADFELVNGTNGAIEAKGGKLTLETGGNTIYNLGVLEAMSGGQLIIDSALNTSGALEAADGGTLTLAAAVTNETQISLNSTGDATYLQLIGDVALGGGGDLTLSDSAKNSIVDNGAAATLDNSDDTITGSGTIGDANLTLVNETGGSIVASKAAAPLILDTGSNVISNAGMLEANIGELVIDSDVDNTGTIEADDGMLLVQSGVSGSGDYVVTEQGVLKFGAAFDDVVSFDGADAGELSLAEADTATIDGFAFADRIDLTYLGAPQSIAFNTIDDQLTVNGATAKATLELDASAADDQFAFASDGDGGVLITALQQTLTATEAASVEATILADLTPPRLDIDDSAADIAADATAIAALTASGRIASVTYEDISGQSFTSKVLSYASKGQIVSKLYEGVTGEGNLTSFEYLYAGNNLVGTDDYYTGISGQSYGAEQLNYNGAGQLTLAVLSDLSSAPYSSYDYDYVGGVFAGSQFNYTKVPQGASYSSYQVDYNQANALTGEKFFFTGLSGLGYTNEEEDFDASAKLSRVLLTGVTGQSYYQLEEDYDASGYEGYKAYYQIAGEPYTIEEVDVSNSNQIEKVVYSGMTSTPYSSVEEDYANGSLTQIIYSYTGVTGATYNAYQVFETAAGGALGEVFDLNSGGHTQIALASGQTLTSQGNDKFTGSSAGSTTFVLKPIFGADTITNLSSADTVSMSTPDFAKFSAFQADAVQSGANVIVTASDGDTLTLKNMTLSTLGGLSNNFTFTA